jgi:hypothetical protein
MAASTVQLELISIQLPRVDDGLEAPSQSKFERATIGVKNQPVHQTSPSPTSS